MFSSYRQAIKVIPNQMLISIGFIGLAFFGLAFNNFRSLLLVEHFNYSYEAMSLVIGLLGLASLFGTWLTGRLLKQQTPNFVIFITLLLSAFGPFILQIFTDEYGVLIGFMFFAIFSSGIRPAFQLMLSEIEDADKRKLAYSLYRVSINSGTAMGSFLGGLIADISYENLLFSATISLIFVSIIFLLSTKTNGQETTEDKREQGLVYLHPLRNRKMILLLLMVFLFCFAMFQIYSFLPIYLVGQLGISKADFGSLSVLNLVIILTLEIYLTTKLKKFGNYIAAALGAIFLAASFFLASFAIDNLFYIYGYYALLSISICLFFPAIMGEIASASDHKVNKSDYMISYQYIIDIIIIVSPFLSAVIVEKFDIPYLWYVCCVVCLITAFLSLFENALQKQNKLNK